MALLQISEPGLSAAPHQRRLAAGIDLGTTNSLVATVRSGQAETLADHEGRHLLPSVVHYQQQGHSVGYDARTNAALDTANTISSVKRLMGRSLADIEEVYLNGDLEHGAPNILNVSFNYVEGESLIMALKDLAVSSGSACTSASLEPSYVLRALGLNDELAHSSIRFSLGRFTTEEEIDYTIELVRKSIGRLRDLSPLWEMYKQGVDLNSIEWAHH